MPRLSRRHCCCPRALLRLLGRAAALNELLRTLRTVETGLCVVTGMPGVGKSALAAEALHLIAADERARHELFPDGIITFSGAGRRGMGGLLALLDELCAVFTPSRHRRAPPHDAARNPPPQASGWPGPMWLARSTAPARWSPESDSCCCSTIWTQRFPLRDALDAVLATGHAAGAAGPIEAERRVVLVTSRYTPEAALIRIRQDVSPLDANAALALFTALLQRDLTPGEAPHARAICMAVGNLPLAIELAATAAVSEGFPLPLLAARLSQPCARYLGR